MAENPYEIDYSDSRFADVEAAKTAALSNVDKTYGDMIGKTDKYYDQQIQATEQWEQKQNQLQQEKTDFTIEQIEQQKEQAQKDYLKEQSGAYTDWQKQSNQYGSNAEQMAAQGMTGTGYSESSQVGMYNTYQMRVAAARESFNRAVLDYDNDIKEARLQNNSAMAQIALESLQKRLELALSGFQYKNQLVLGQADKKLEVESLYHNMYMDVLDQINQENALAEQVRQFNYYNKLGEFAKKGSGGGGGYGGNGGNNVDYGDNDGIEGNDVDYGEEVADDLSTETARSEHIAEKNAQKNTQQENSKSVWDKIVEYISGVTINTGGF